MSGLLWLEDLTVGRRFAAGPVRVEAADIVAFARAFDPQPMHLDPAAAVASPFGGLVASGWHTGALTMHLLTQALPIAGGVAGSGGEIRWPRPVRPGDVLRIECEVTEVHAGRFGARRGWAVVRVTTVNGADEVVQVWLSRIAVPHCTPPGS